MDGSTYEQLLIRRLINNFRRDFKYKTGKKISIRVEGEEYDERAILTLGELKEIVNQYNPLKDVYPDFTANRRILTLVWLRFIYILIAVDMGYRLTSISEALFSRRNRHDKVIYGRERGKELLITEPAFKNLYQTILNHVKNERSSIIPTEESSESEPVLSNVVL